MINTEPSATALAWVAAASGAAEAHVVRRLAGGTHAPTHLVATIAPARELVLRRYPAGDPAPAREALALAALDGLGGWAPELVAADPDGARCGEPASLLTRLPGHADINPQSPERAARQLGHALARIHTTPLTALGGLRDGMTAGSSAPTGPAAPALAELRPTLAAQPRVLTHFDYWSGNVLWESDQLTGVVDWSGAALAPRGFDVSWCRLDLVLLHGPDAARAFLDAYQETAEPVPAMAAWDLFALGNSHTAVEGWLPNYHDLGRADMTSADLRARHTAWLDDRLRSG
ncbi:phosphotransferase family protein [Longispora fulva]|uniref:phosphotransferase family protein n=1 Tax=Longispora fulva TaxID=619741 RepID=UPI00364363E0